MATSIDELQIEINTIASNASNGVTGLTTRLNNLSRAINGINTAQLNDVASGIGAIGENSGNTSVGLTKTAKSADKATKSFNGLASAFGKFYATYFLLIRGAKSIWSDIKSAMDYVETYNYFAVSLGKIGSQFGEQFQQFGYESAEAYIDSFEIRLNELNKKLSGYTLGESGELLIGGDIGLGMDIEQMMNFQAKTLAVTNSVGLLGETSINTAKAISMLAGDLSSLTNTDLKSVMTNLTSGLIGQSRALYKYGIDITNNTLQQYALAEGIEKSVAEMTQSEKMQLRLLAILDQSKVAWGDLGNTVNSVANQYRISEQQIGNLERTLGNVFLPIVKNVLPYVNGMIIALNELFNTIGFSLYGDTWLEELQEGVSGGVQSGFEDMEDAADDATNSVNKLKKSVRAFDELNIISVSSGITSNGLTRELNNTVDLTQSISDAVADYEMAWNTAFTKAENKASEFAETLKKMFVDIDTGQLSNLSVALTGIGSALSLIVGIKGLEKGLNIATSGIKGLMAAVTGHPYLTIAAGITAIATAYLAWETTSSGIDYTNINNAIKEAKEAISGVDGVYKDFSSTLSELDNKKQAVTQAVEDYFTLLNDPDVDFSEKEGQLKSYVEYITNKFPELVPHVNEHTGLFESNKEVILSNIDALTDYAKTLAAQNIMVEAYEKLYQAKREYAEFLDEFDEYSKEYTEKYMGLGGLDPGKSPGFTQAQQKMKELQETNEALLKAIEDGEKFITALEDGSYLLEDVVTDTEKSAFSAYGNITEKSEETKNSIVTAFSNAGEASDKVFQDIQNAENNTSKTTDNLTTKFSNFGNITESATKKATDGVNEFKTAVSDLQGMSVDIPINFTTNANSVFSNFGNFSSTPAFSSSNVLSSIVSSNVNNRINNIDSSAQNIGNMVYNAVKSAVSSISPITNLNVTLEGDAGEIFRVVQDKADDYYNRTQKSAFP